MMFKGFKRGTCKENGSDLLICNKGIPTINIKQDLKDQRKITVEIHL